jgi:glycosyltransferase involved in cell wall biosynthesis
VRVAIDLRTLQDPVVGGIGRTLRHVVPLIARTVDLLALTDERLAPIDDLPVPQHALRGPVSGRSVAWLQLAVPRFLRGYDGVFHCPFYGLPYRQPTPMVVTLHDVTFEDHPEWFPSSKRATFRAQARWAARTARRIITVSAHEAHRIQQVYDVEPSRVVVAPNAVDPIFRPQPAPPSLAGTRYVVALGGAPRRRLSAAIEAWRGLRAEHPEVALVIVGGEQPPAEEGVIVCGPLDDATWAAVLSGAEAFCYPTLYEGFGMPALEACASGTPVVCAPVGALPEVLGEAAEWSADTSSEAVGRALSNVLGDPRRATDLRAAGLERARSAPGWGEIAARYVEAYEAAAHG